MSQSNTAGIAGLSLAEVERRIGQQFQLLSNAQVADHLQRGLLSSDHPDHLPGFEYAKAEARRRVGPAAIAAENAAWHAFEARWGLSSDMSEADFGAIFDQIPDSEWPQGGAHFLTAALRGEL